MHTAAAVDEDCCDSCCESDFAMIVGFCAFTLAAGILLGLFVYHMVDARLSRIGRQQEGGDDLLDSYSSGRYGGGGGGGPFPGEAPDADYTGPIVPSYALQIPDLDALTYARAGNTGGGTGAKQAINGLATIQRRNAVKEAMSYSWQAYAQTCFGKDELMPPSQQ